MNMPEMFQEVLQRCADMNNEEYVEWSERARKYGLGVTKDDGVVEQNRKLFYQASESESLRVVSQESDSLESGSQRGSMEKKKIKTFEDIVGWPRLNKRYKGLTG